MAGERALPAPSALAGASRRADASRRFRVAPAIWLAGFALLLFLATPLVALLLRAAEETESLDVVTSETVRQAIRLTFVTSLISLAIVLLLGTPLAYALARGRIPARRLIDTVIDLPMVLPPAVAGIALLMAFGRRGIVGQHLDAVGITIGFTSAAVVMAQVFVSVPYYVRAARAGFTRVDRAMEEAAADLGASPSAVFRTITIPLVRPSLAAGAVLAWARAVGEFGATIMFAGNFAGKTQTMPLAIYGRYEAGDLDTALILSVVLLAAAMLVLFAVRSIGPRQPDYPS
ncbi:MAG: molybdate ABC transporter permease subunit [Thermomicrobiales bacterium]|nr:molybdate ABC transporter permease subunit [Thermomicrobiales bacterium]